MLLRMRDIQPQLQQKWLQLYWPDDSRWWPAQVTEVNPKRHRAHLLYETGVPLQHAGDKDAAGWHTCYLTNTSTASVSHCNVSHNMSCFYLATNNL